MNVSSFILPDAAIQIWPTEIFLTEKKSRIFTVKGCVSLRINLSLMPSTQTKINFLKVEEKFQKKYDKARKKCNQWSSLFISWKTKGCQSFRIWLWKDKIYKRFHQRYRAFSHNFTIFFDNLTCRFKNDNLIIFTNVTFQRRFDQSYCK